jgi:hypothetical protein
MAMSPVLETAQNQAGSVFGDGAQSRSHGTHQVLLVREVPRQFSEFLAGAGQVSFLQQRADDVRLRLSRNNSGTPPANR